MEEIEGELMQFKSNMVMIKEEKSELSGKLSDAKKEI